MTHEFDGERSGTGETCLAVVDGAKCYQRATHPVHNKQATPDTHTFEGSTTGNNVCMNVTDGIFCCQPAATHAPEPTPLPGTEGGDFRVVVEAYGNEALSWEGFADNVSDALSRALDAREDQVRGGEWWKTAGKDGGPL